MGRVLTNNTNLQYAVESSLGVAGTDWNLLEPNNVPNWGATIATVARDPISRNRQLRAGTITDLDSAVELEMDVTGSAIIDFADGFVFSNGVNRDLDLPVSAVDGTGDAYTVAALSALQADRLEFSAAQYASLIYARGFTDPANNGLKSLDADIATAATAISVAEVLVEEASPASNAQIELGGLRSLAAAADFTWTWNAGTRRATLSSAADIADFSVFGITPGQTVHIGSFDGTGIVNGFENAAANDMVGYARVVTVSAGTITFDNVEPALQFTDASAPTTAVDILFGKFYRPVAVDQPDFLERSFTFEATWDNLQEPGPGDEYEYPNGNFCNLWTWNINPQDKATMNVAFVGLDTPPPGTTRLTGADTPIAPVMTEALNTSADLARLRVLDVDDSGLTTDFSTLSLTINNNVGPEKVLGRLGARFLNFGNLEVNFDSTILFTDSAVIAAVRNNTTVGFDFKMQNSDISVVFDMPSLKLGNGARDLPRNETVRVNLTGQAFIDPIFGTSLGISTLPPLK